MTTASFICQALDERADLARFSTISRLINVADVAVAAWVFSSSRPMRRQVDDDDGDIEDLNARARQRCRRQMAADALVSYQSGIDWRRSTENASGARQSNHRRRRWCFPSLPAPASDRIGIPPTAESENENEKKTVPCFVFRCFREKGTKRRFIFAFDYQPSDRHLN